MVDKTTAIESTNREPLNAEHEKTLRHIYGDSVFRQLFSNEKEARDLFNLLEGTDYGEDTKVEIQTLDNALFVDRVNDLSFTIGDRLIVLIEHQKTENRNMPFRMLMYISRTLEKLYGDKKIYHDRLIKLRMPEFFMLYDGDAETEPVFCLRLSDAFLAAPPENSIEVVVKVFNIRYNKGKELLKNDSMLAQYSRFTEIVRKVKAEGYEGERALREIMMRCHKENILVDFLLKHDMEAIRMAWGEFNLEEYIEGEREISEQKGSADLLEAMQKATEYMENNGRSGEVSRLIKEPAFLSSVLKEAGISYGR